MPNLLVLNLKLYWQKRNPKIVRICEKNPTWATKLLTTRPSSMHILGPYVLNILAILTYNLHKLRAYNNKFSSLLSFHLIVPPKFMRWPYLIIHICCQNEQVQNLQNLIYSYHLKLIYYLFLFLFFFWHVSN